MNRHKIFLNKKRNFDSNELTYENLTDNGKDNLFQSILQKPNDSEEKNISIINNILKECGIFFVPKIEYKKEQYISSKFPLNKKYQNDINDSNLKKINDVIAKGQKCI